MKTIEDLRIYKASILADIEGINGMSLSSAVKNRKINLQKKKLSWVRDMIMYLETGPTEEFMKKELQRLSNRYVLIMRHAPEGLLKLSSSAKYMAFKRQHGLDTLERHIKNIKFILS